jgi:hypothetical protein
MKFKSPGILFALIVILMLPLACNFPGAGSVGSETAVAQTVEAELTKAAATAGTATSTLAVTETPTLTATNTETPVPTVTSTPVLTFTNTPIPCNRAAFVSDVTIPDDSEIVINANFTKTWRLQNTGSCTWTSGYKIIFDSGDQMSAPAETQLTAGSVAPGATVDVSVNMKAPGSAGTYKGNYRIKSSDGIVFGVGAGNVPFYVQIKAITPTLPPPPEPLFPDLYVSEFQINYGNPIDDDVPIHVRLGVYNQGTAAAGAYTVRFWGLETFANHSCEWDVPSTNAKGGRILECDMQYASIYADGLRAMVKVDVGNTVAESNESNNTFYQPLNFVP